MRLHDVQFLVIRSGTTESIYKAVGIDTSYSEVQVSLENLSGEKQNFQGEAKDLVDEISNNTTYSARIESHDIDLY